MVIALWLATWYFVGKHNGKLDSSKNQELAALILNTANKEAMNSSIETYGKMAELLAEESPKGGTVIYLATFGGYYFYKVGYKSTYKAPALKFPIYTGNHL